MFVIVQTELVVYTDSFNLYSESVSTLEIALTLEPILENISNKESQKILHSLAKQQCLPPNVSKEEFGALCAL